MKKMKPLLRANCTSLDKRCEFYIEMLSYNLTEIKLAELKNFFLIKNKTLLNSYQQKLSTKRVDSLSCN